MRLEVPLGGETQIALAPVKTISLTVQLMILQLLFVESEFAAWALHVSAIFLVSSLVCSG